MGQARQRQLAINARGDVAKPNADLGRTWVDDIPGLRARRRATALRFCSVVTIEQPNGLPPIEITSTWKGGLEEGHERGLVRLEPQGDRVLLRSIVAEDATKPGGIVPPWEQDARRLMLQEVIAVGPGCAQWYDKMGVPEPARLHAGDFCWCLSTVADRLATMDRTLRLMTVRVEYIAAKVHPLQGPPLIVDDEPPPAG